MRYKPRFSPAVIFGIALLLCAAAAQAAGEPIPHGTLELVAENQWIAPGHEFYLGLHFQLEKGWHIYWVNPGDSGEPPHVTWQLPAGLIPGAIEWPTPRRIEASGIVNFGYDDRVMLVVLMHASASLAEQPTRFGAEVNVVVCREMCIAGKAQLSLTLPVRFTDSSLHSDTFGPVREDTSGRRRPNPHNVFAIRRAATRPH